MAENGEIVEVQVNDGIYVYKNIDNGNYSFSYQLTDPAFSFLNYAETTSDYQYSVVGSMASKKVYVLKFEENYFSLYQIISANNSVIKPSITDDHSYIAFGDKKLTENVVEIYSFNPNIGFFEKFKTQIVDKGVPQYCSLSANHKTLIVSTTDQTEIH